MGRKLFQRAWPSKRGNKRSTSGIGKVGAFCEEIKGNLVFSIFLGYLGDFVNNVGEESDVWCYIIVLVVFKLMANVEWREKCCCCVFQS